MLSMGSFVVFDEKALLCNTAGPNVGNISPESVFWPISLRYLLYRLDILFLMHCFHIIMLCHSLQCNNTGTPHLTVEITTVITLASSCNYCNKCTRKLVHLLYEFHSQARGINMVIPQQGVVLPYIIQWL